MNDEQLRSYKPTAEEIRALKKATADIPPGIPVARLRLHRPMQVPGKQADDSIKAETLPNGRRWTIEFVPQIRHHRITYYDDRRGEPEVGYVHESHVLTFWPA